MLEMTGNEIGLDLMMLKKRCLELYQENRKLKEMVYTDGLTGLHNFRYMKVRLDEELERARRHRRNLSFIMIDMDNLKQINDTFGHQMGNRVIMEIATTIKNSIRNIDLAARFGGDEFAVLLPDTTLASALIIIERIVHHVNGLYFLCPGSKRGINVTVSGGVVSFDGHEKSADDFIHEADKLLYRAKMAGKNCVMHADVPPLPRAVGFGSLLHSLSAKILKNRSSR